MTRRGTRGTRARAWQETTPCRWPRARSRKSASRRPDAGGKRCRLRRSRAALPRTTAMLRASRRPFLQPDAAAAAVARRALVDELDPEAVKRGDQLHQRLDVAADHAVARFHALDRRQ